MKNLIRTCGIGLLAFMGILSSCSDEDYQSPDDLSVNSSVVHKEVPDFVATLSPQQRENLEKTGEIFLPEQRKDSWNDIIAEDVPTRWGCFQFSI